jgi:hypothetical protein
VHRRSPAVYIHTPVEYVDVDGLIACDGDVGCLSAAIVSRD